MAAAKPLLWRGWGGLHGAVTDINANVSQTVSYAPFGEVFIEERNNKWNTPYLFNSKQLDEETGLYYYGARYYDPRVSIFISVDRFAEKYPNISGYSYCANNPVKFIDINGDSIWITHGTGFLGLGKKETLRYDEGNLYNKDGSAYTGKVKGFLDKTVKALNTIGALNSGDNMLNELQSSTENFTIIKTNDGNSYNTGSNTVKFNPSSKQGGLNTRGTTDRPAFIGLAHELAHALDDGRGTINLHTIPGQTFRYAEHFSTHLENQIRAEHLLPLRTHYGIDATGAGVYPLVNSGNSIHYPGYNYYDALKIKLPAIPLLKIALPSIPLLKIK